MRKALFVTDKYQDGHPYNLDSPDFVETANRLHAHDVEMPNIGGVVWMKVKHPYYDWPTSTSACLIELKSERKPDLDVCGGCGASEENSTTSLLICATCSSRKYCSKGCQAEQWAVHQKVCRA